MIVVAPIVRMLPMWKSGVFQSLHGYGYELILRENDVRFSGGDAVDNEPRDEVGEQAAYKANLGSF